MLAASTVAAAQIRSNRLAVRPEPVCVVAHQYQVASYLS